ncbi:MAG TPA: orotidine 5'-phosphate decarboxylase, partial [Victivallales bacterium]|nr:orotidine 5'-phosphate decarboxylase [Victivallales bacterium]
MSELIVALDLDSIKEVETVCDKIGDSVEWFKIGSVLFSKYGPESVAFLKARRKKIFLDLKYHDIPNTVSGAVRNAVSLGVDMVNVHASGGVA